MMKCWSGVLENMQGAACTISWSADRKYLRTATRRTCTCIPRMRGVAGFWASWEHFEPLSTGQCCRLLVHHRLVHDQPPCGRSWEREVAAAASHE